MRVPTRLPRARLGALPLFCLLLTFAGCGFRTYEPKPLDPPKSAAEVSSRSLEAPALRDYLQGRGVAVDPWPRADWTLAALTWVALYHSPELDIARAQVAVARAGEVTSAQRPNPAIQLGGQHHSETGPPRESPWTVSLILDLPIVTGGKREAQMARAQALSEGALLDLAAAAWQARSRVQARYVDCYAATEEARLADAEAALRQEELALIERRVERGFASATDATAARPRLAEARLARARAAARLEEARGGLAQALGASVASVQRQYLSFSDLKAQLPQGSDGDLQAVALQNRLDIRRGLANYAVAEANLQFEVARQYPDLVLRPGYIWDQGDRIWALGSFVLLPLMNRNEGPILEAEARRTLEADRFLALQTRAIGIVAARAAGYQATQRELVAANALQRDAAERTARAERRFDAGDADRLERTRARLEAVIAERLAFASEVHGLQTYVQLEDAVQAPLDGSAVPVADPVTPRLAQETR